MLHACKIEFQLPRFSFYWYQQKTKKTKQNEWERARYVWQTSSKKLCYFRIACNSQCKTALIRKHYDPPFASCSLQLHSAAWSGNPTPAPSRLLSSPARRLPCHRQDPQPHSEPQSFVPLLSSHKELLTLGQFLLERKTTAPCCEMRQKVWRWPATNMQTKSSLFCLFCFIR